jgi:tellurite resistance protein TerC
VLASLFSPAGQAQTVIANARRHATDYLDLGYTKDHTERIRVYNALLQEEESIRRLRPKYRHMARDEAELTALLRKAHIEHDQSVKRAAREQPNRPATQ